MRRIILLGVTLGMFLVCLCVSRPVWGQQTTAAITGTLMDEGGAAINGATITVTDTDRGTVYTATSNDGGIYNFVRVPIGNYQVKAEAPGFQSAVQTGLTLVLNQTARIDFKMHVGTVTTTAQVTSEAPQLQTETTQVSTLIDSKTVTDIPLATRNYVQLTLLAPGSIHPDASQFNNGDNTANGARPFINGNREESDNFILDGMDNNQTSDNLLAFTPTPDAIQEFNLITNNASAEFGNFMGGIVNASIKSGTNGFHGDAWEFFRNDILNANQWENKLDPTQVLAKPTVRWNMFGGTLGGPIIKDKLFFFVDYQGQRFDHPASSNFITVFTNAERGGDFRSLYGTDSKGNVTGQLMNPVTGAPYPNNQIPISQMNVVAKNLFASKYYPTPINGQTTNNAINTVTQAYNADQGDVKIDYAITPSDRFEGRYSQAYQTDPGSNSLLILGTGFAQAPIHNVVGTWTHTFGPTILNEARFGTSWVTLFNGSGFDPSIGNLGTQLGIANTNGSGPGLLLLGFGGGNGPAPTGGTTLTNVGSQVVQQDFADTVIQFDDSVTITHGKHVFKTGFQMWRYRINTGYTGNTGEYGDILFGPSFTNNADFAGAPEADFFLGYPEARGIGVSTSFVWHQMAWLFGGYGQDDWHITPTLTLNLGLRYEARTPWVELNNRQSNLDLTTGALELAGQNGNSRALYNSVYGLPAVQPRFGFAWSPAAMHGKTVVRGAYGISSYLEGTGTNLRLPRNPPFTPPEVGAVYTSATVQTQAGPGGATPGNPFVGATMFVWDKTVQPALDQEWNLTLQQEVSPTMTFQIGYVAQKADHLMVPMPYLQKQLVNGVATTPFYFNNNPALINVLGQVSGTASVGYMNYNALQAVLEKRLSNGLAGQVAYTWSHCLTNNSGYYGTWGAAAQSTTASPYYQNLYNPAGDYASCYYNANNIVSAYATYDLPFGRGKQFGANLNPVVNQVVGGWQASTIVSTHSGFPLAVYGSGDETGTGSRGARPDCGVQTVYKRSHPASVLSQGLVWMSPSGYSDPAPGHFGNCPLQGPVNGPGYFDADIGLMKNFHITEGKYVQFRTDFLNAFNNVNLGMTNTNFSTTSTTFGDISTSQPARNIQFALKFYF
jgi:Carboxypeptidase regulatory-like domain